MTSNTVEIVLEASAQPRLIGALRELWSFRGTIIAFAERDILVKDKQATSWLA